jgi:signal transduction histidine kinase/CheY-like chemotaxis protein
MHDFIVNGYKISEKITNELNTKGETVYFSNNSVGIIENGKLVRMWGTQTDVTERVNLHNDLVKAKNKAEESDRLKSVFLANISHEIRTPMNAILGFLELLKNPDLIREDKDSFIDIINQSGQRLLSTINDLVEISKIEAGQLDVVSSEVNLADFILYIYKMLVPQCQKKGLELSLSDSARNAQVVIKTDKYKLEGILINLINNAIKFTKTGGIAIDLALDADKILFMVKDTGIGIPFDRQKAIFDRFVHAEMDNTRPYEGSGLGLSIAKAYVELLQGEIWVESDGKNGSTFYFTIEHNPIRRLTVDTIVPENLIGIKSKITILVAEDDEFSFKLVEGILANQNVTLIHLFNGEDAVQYVRENPNTSLILMDIKMPIMNGIEATKRIREFNKTIPIIAQTAYALSGDRDKVIEAGCNDYISKPLNHSLLIKLVKEYTEQ